MQDVEEKRLLDIKVALIMAQSSTLARFMLAWFLLYALLRNLGKPETDQESMSCGSRDMDESCIDIHR